MSDDENEVQKNIYGGIDEADFVQQATEQEKFKKDEAVIPFSRILQPLSPQLNEVPGAAAGMIHNAATNNLIDGKKGCLIVPVKHQWSYTEWVSREDGGGFVADWGESEDGWQSKCDLDQRIAYKPVTRDGHVIVKARHFAIFILYEDGTIEPSILPFTGTALKVARQWSSMMQNAPKLMTSKGMMTPAFFYYVYQLNTELVKNNSYTWYEPRVKPLIKENKFISIMDFPNGKEIWDMSIAFVKSLRAGTVRGEAQQVEYDDPDRI